MDDVIFLIQLSRFLPNSRWYMFVDNSLLFVDTVFLKLTYPQTHFFIPTSVPVLPDNLSTELFTGVWYKNISLCKNKN